MNGDNFSPQGGKLILNDGSIVDINNYFYNVFKNFYENNQEVIVYQKRHKMIHLGKYFSVQKLITVPGEDKKTIAGETSTKYVHVVPPILKTTLSKVVFNIYEDVEYSNGNDMIIRNHNRNFSDSTHKWVEIVSDPTINDYGSTIIYNDYIPGGTGIGGTSYGGSNSEIQEYVFKPNSKYCMDIINNDSDPQDIYVSFAWYWTDTATD